MSKIFISYRREDTIESAGRMYDWLTAHLPADSIFMDVDSIPIGADFRQIIERTISQTQVMLVIIGQKWLNIADATGQRRLDNPQDFVRIEIEAALRRNIAVIPVLVQDVSMPPANSLPSSLQVLSYKNAIVVHPNPYFSHDMERLASAIESFTPSLHFFNQPVSSHRQRGTTNRNTRILAWLSVFLGILRIPAIALALSILIASPGIIGILHIPVIALPLSSLIASPEFTNPNSINSFNIITLLIALGTSIPLTIYIESSEYDARLAKATTTSNWIAKMISGGLGVGLFFSFIAWLNFSQYWLLFTFVIIIITALITPLLTRFSRWLKVITPNNTLRNASGIVLRILQVISRGFISAGLVWYIGVFANQTDAVYIDQGGVTAFVSASIFVGVIGLIISSIMEFIKPNYINI